MSTENTQPQDEVSTSGVEAHTSQQVEPEPSETLAATEAVDSSTAPEAETEPEVTASPEALSKPQATGDETPTVTEEEAASKRKVKLRPTLTAEDARPVPTIQGGPVIPAAPGPVEMPAKDDADVEKEIAKAVSGLATTEGSSDTPAGEEPGTVAVPKAESIDASIEAAIEAAMAEQDKPPATTEAGAADGAPAADTKDLDQLQQGQKLQGTVQSVHGDSVFLDFGMRLSGVVPFRQFNQKNPPKEGDTIDVNFDRIDETEGLILTNLPRGTSVVQGGDWDSVAPDQIVECMVTKTNKGGLEVSVGSLRGFIPASQVELGFVEDLAVFVGQKIRAQIIEVKPAKKRLVLSRRKILAEERKAAKEELLSELKPDQIRTGCVKTIKDYGAFVDLGGTDGFLPIAQMSWIRIGHPSELISEGQEIEVKILSIDREKDRISLGMRQLTPNPWRQAEAKYEKGSTVTGRVTKTEAFGAFVELEPGIEGLVHISELDHRRVKRVTEVLNVEDMIEVQVLDIDPAKKRISLSVKALKAKPEPIEKPKDEDLAPGQGEKYERKRNQPLKGGIGGPSKGGLFGNPRDFEGK